MLKINKERKIKKYINISNRRKKIKGGITLTTEQQQKYSDYKELYSLLNDLINETLLDTTDETTLDKKKKRLLKRLKNIMRLLMILK